MIFQRIEKLLPKLNPAIFFLSVFITTLVYLWRCQMSVDLTDEAFYLVPPWKLFKLGDAPFRNEIYNGLRNSDLLNSIFVQPFISFSVIKLRMAAVLVYALCLMVLFVAAFRMKLGWMASLAFMGCLTFDYFLMPTWSYNWWVRNALLIHQSFLLWAMRSQRSKRFLFSLGAGVSMGVATIAYNTVLAVLVLNGLFILVFNRWWSTGQVRMREFWIPYCLGGIVTVVLDFAYLAQPSVFPYWVDSVHSLLSLADYTVTQGSSRVLLLISYMCQLWPYALCLFVCLTFQNGSSPVVRWIGKWPLTLLGLISIIFLVSRFFHLSLIDESLRLFLTFGLLCAFLLVVQGFIQANGWLSTLGVSALSSAFVLCLSSTNSAIALYWIMPVAIIPWLSVWMSGWNDLKRLSAVQLNRVGVMVALVGIAYGAFQHQRLRSYYDVPPGNCDTVVKVDPLRGLRTSSRRAFLIEKLSEFVGDQKFVLAFADIPGTFLFSKVRQSVDTILVEAHASRFVQRRSVRRILEYGRIPGRIIRAKIHPWYWGIQHPTLSRKAIDYSQDDPYMEFTRCVAEEKIANYDEFEVYTVKTERVQPCVERAAGE